MNYRRDIGQQLPHAIAIEGIREANQAVNSGVLMWVPTTATKRGHYWLHQSMRQWLDELCGEEGWQWGTHNLWHYEFYFRHKHHAMQFKLAHA